jgi:hypothetical protein
MTLAYDASIRNAQLDAITTRAGASALTAHLRRHPPRDRRHPTTKLAELVCNATFAAAAAAGVLTLNAIATDVAADATGTATWFRIVKSDGTTFVMDGSVGVSGADLNFNSVAFTVGGSVAVSSFTITAGNP